MPFHMVAFLLECHPLFSFSQTWLVVQDPTWFLLPGEVSFDAPVQVAWPLLSLCAPLLLSPQHTV